MFLIIKLHEKAILSLKKCHVDIKIKELQKLITEGSSESSVLNQLSELTKVKTQISKSLGRNVGWFFVIFIA